MTKRKYQPVPKRQCTSMSKQSGEQCKNRPKVGWEVCHIHGGKTPRGIASPHFKHGKFAQDLPTDLRERYEELRQDEELMSLRDSIALVGAFLSQALQSMSRKEAGVLWGDLKKAWTRFQREWRKGENADTSVMATHLSEMNRIISEGYADYMIRLEVERLSLTLGKLVDLEGKQLERLQQTITVERAMLFVQALSDSVHRNVKDQRAKAAIANDILAIVGGSIRALTAPVTGERA